MNLKNTANRLSCVARKTLHGFPPGLQPQKMVRGFKFQIEEEEGLYYLCNEKKDTDQLRSYSAADLCLCFRKSKNHVFS